MAELWKLSELNEKQGVYIKVLEIDSHSMLVSGFLGLVYHLMNQLAEGLLCNVLAETCHFYTQNLPTIVTLLPCAGLALGLQVSFFSHGDLPGRLSGLSILNVDQSIVRSAPQ